MKLAEAQEAQSQAHHAMVAATKSKQESSCEAAQRMGALLYNDTGAGDMVDDVEGELHSADSWAKVNGMCVFRITAEDTLATSGYCLLPSPVLLRLFIFIF